MNNYKRSRTITATTTTNSNPIFPPITEIQSTTTALQILKEIQTAIKPTNNPDNKKKKKQQHHPSSNNNLAKQMIYNEHYFQSFVDIGNKYGELDANVGECWLQILADVAYYYNFSNDEDDDNSESDDDDNTSDETIIMSILTKTKTFKIIVHLLQVHFQQKTVSMCNALNRLEDNYFCWGQIPGFKRALITAGIDKAMTMIVNTILNQNQPDDASIVAVLGAISMLAAGGGEDEPDEEDVVVVQNSICRSELCSKIVSTLNNACVIGKIRIDIVDATCACIVTLSSNNQTSKTTFGNVGACEALLKAAPLCQDEANADVLTRILDGIYNLSSNKVCKTRLIKANAVSILKQIKVKDFKEQIKEIIQQIESKNKE
jgi:hypothetical protein